MSWPFLYFADDPLSRAELTGARLDGDLVEVGEAYMPADAVETRELRAASLRRLIPPSLTVVRASAAWVHGAVMDAPTRHAVQRRSAVRPHQLLDARLVYHDHPLPPGVDERVGGIWVTTPAQTLADLARAQHSGEVSGAHVDALLRWRPELAAEAVAVLERAGAVHFKRAALAMLRERADAVTPAASETVRTT